MEGNNGRHYNIWADVGVMFRAILKTVIQNDMMENYDEVSL